MKQVNSKQSVALSSVFASALLTLLKLVVGVITGSMGIISEAAHSFLDLGAATLTYFAVKIGDKPPDLTHPYGHGKVESVSALIETGLLFLTSAWIIYEAIKRLVFHTAEVEVAWYSFAVMIVSIVIDYSRSRALSKVAKETKSQALEADALHFSSDILSSMVVIVGLTFVHFGIQIGDAIAAIGVSLFVLHAGYQLGKRTIYVLVDTAPEGITEKITKLTKTIEGVLGIEKIRVRLVGAVIFVDMIITVSRKLPLEQAHKICNLIGKKVQNEIPEVDITVHTKPLPLDNETIIERVQIIALNHSLSVHDIVVHELDKKRYLSFDLEVKANLSIKEAHRIASHLEKTIKSEIGDDIKINTHIEPLLSEVILGETVSDEEQEKIKKTIEKISKQLTLVKEVHEVLIRKARGKFFISLHCLFENEVMLEDTHNIASRFEYLVREKLPETQRVIVHAEPLV